MDPHSAATETNKPSLAGLLNHGRSNRFSASSSNNYYYKNNATGLSPLSQTTYAPLSPQARRCTSNGMSFPPYNTSNSNTHSKQQQQQGGGDRSPSSGWGMNSGGGRRRGGANQNNTPNNVGGSSSCRHSPTKAGGLVPSPPPPNSPSSPLHMIISITGDPLIFNETNMDWTKLNIFRTRLCDRLTQTRTCHMANRCLFSHDMSWPRRTPFLPRATALTLRYIPVWCPRLAWPPLTGLCDSMGKISWSSNDPNWDSHFAHSSCVRGDNCPFAHNLEEFLYHPEVYKTRSCCLASEDGYDENATGNCIALCPWYFCPFAHDVYELRDLRGARYAWHLPPQIVDNHFVARTQGFDEIELGIIDFVRKASNGALELYTSLQSPLRKLASYRLPPVFRPLPGSSLERLVASSAHKEIVFDDLLYFMVVSSLLNLLLYPVENFYIPTLLSLQCAVLQFQLRLSRTAKLDCIGLLQEFDAHQHHHRHLGPNLPLSSSSVKNNSPPSPRHRTQSPMLSFEQLSCSAGVNPAPLFYNATNTSNNSPTTNNTSTTNNSSSSINNNTNNDNNNNTNDSMNSGSTGRTSAAPKWNPCSGLELPQIPSTHKEDLGGRSPSSNRSATTATLEAFESASAPGLTPSHESNHLQSLLELFHPDELMKVMALFSSPEAAGSSEQDLFASFQQNKDDSKRPEQAQKDSEEGEVDEQPEDEHSRKVPEPLTPPTADINEGEKM